jgi:hypothetical protein
MSTNILKLFEKLFFHWPRNREAGGENFGSQKEEPFEWVFVLFPLV